MWEVTTLGQSCTFFNGKAHEKAIDENGEYVVVNSKFISTEGKVIKRTTEQMFPLVINDIAMVMSDVPNGKALAKCYIIEKDNKYSLNQRICCIKSDIYDIKFLYYQLNRNQYLLAFDNKGSQANLRKADILSCPLSLPPLDEQKRIVAILDEAFLGIDQAIANTEKNLVNAKELFESYLNNIFTQKGDDSNLRELGNVAYLAGRIGWKGLTAKEYTESGPLFLSVHSLNYGNYVDYRDANHITHERYDESPEIMLQADDILICKDGAGIGKLGMIKELPSIATINSSMLLIRPENNLKTEYLYYYLLSSSFQKIIRERIDGATTPHLYQREIKKLTIPIVDEASQDALIQKMNFLSNNIKELEGAYNHKLTALKELKQSLLQKAFAGELTSDIREVT